MLPTTIEEIKKAVIKIESGKIYKIVNVKTGTVIDLGCLTKKEVSGWKENDGDNQKWKLVQIEQENHWHISSILKDDKNRTCYLGITDKETRIQTCKKPYRWDIWLDENKEKAFRIFMHNGPSPGLNFDMKGSGSGDGTPIILYPKRSMEEGGENQMWYFVEASLVSASCCSGCRPQEWQTVATCLIFVMICLICHNLYSTLTAMIR